MVLAHRERLTPRITQAEWAAKRVRDNKNVAGLPAPGVYARHNAVDTPALLPDGTPSGLSVSRVLVARDQVATDRGPQGRRAPHGARDRGRSVQVSPMHYVYLVGAPLRDRHGQPC